MKSYILLENIKIFAYHGVFEEENQKGNNFLINLKLKVKNSPAFISDDINQTINYADVYDIIYEEMGVISNLLEHVAWRIIQALKKKYAQIIKVEIKLSKLTPPISGDVEAASVLIID